MSAAEDIHRMALMVSPSYRLAHQGIRIDGGQLLDFQAYPYLPRIIDSRKRKTTVTKGAQMGFTIAAILKALVLAGESSKQGRPKLRGIGYWFPGDKEAQVFSRARFRPLMEQNQHVWQPGQIDVDSAELKRIGEVAIYLRGAGQKGIQSKSASGVKSIPLDVNIMDERDEMDDARVDAINHRLDGSECPQELIFSTPTLPGYGVDLEYAESDQSLWYWTCEKCNGETCLEATYPDCIAEPTNGEPFYLCSKCRGELSRSDGRWEATKPEVTDHEGLRVSQLSSTKRSAADIVEEVEKAERSGRFRELHNQVLGRAYAEVEDQITEQQIRELLRNEPRPLRHAGPAAMGVDPGKPHWYEVRIRIGERDTLQIARGRADTYEELEKIAKRYNVESGVMDKGYDPSAVSRFCEANRGWYGCRYIAGKKADPTFNHHKHEVTVGRTWLLDSAHHDILQKRVSFYQEDDFFRDFFVPQMTNLKRSVTVVNKDTGEVRVQWVVTQGQKNDHLRHAGAYCWLATTRVSLSRERQKARDYDGEPRRRNRGRPKSFAQL